MFLGRTLSWSIEWSDWHQMIGIKVKAALFVMKKLATKQLLLYDEIGYFFDIIIRNGDKDYAEI